MNRKWIALVMLALGANFACAASFDCDKAGTKVEKMICADPELSKLDEELGKAYNKALEANSDQASIKQKQRDWLKERRYCTEKKCLKSAYKKRLLAFSRKDVSTSADTTIKQNSETNQRYRFQLTKGSGVAVCDAYLERLNTTKYESPPYCGRPENDSVEGFAKLNRVPLSPNDVHDLYPIIRTYISMANRKGLDWFDKGLQQHLEEKGQFRMTAGEAKAMLMSMDSGWAKIWRYNPLVDIDNDGIADNVEIWHGTPARGEGGTVCGKNRFMEVDGPPVRQPQIAFVVTGDGGRLDVAKTEKVFEHPSGGYRFYSDYEKRSVISNDFRPIGKSIGIFKYTDTYYFDTFFDGWGDFEDKRRIEGVKDKNKNKDIINTLGVFLNKGGVTKQVCEYLMTDSDTQYAGSEQ